ncbi:ABC transporter permease [Larkinella soli]|uniref:ABC transporter permease n=1 Tax=Larkinella soli TaxID=1770527 RepID=UPI000FFB2154|nr:ABC transporter permease [Larkinella soli]
MKANPPFLAERLLAWFCAPHLLEEVQGDLHERYLRDLDRFGAGRAGRRYWVNVLSFIRPFALKRRPADFPTPSLFHPVMLRNYLKTSFRSLTKHKVSTLINLFGLTLGILACLGIYLITDYELSFDTFHPDRERIYRLVGEGQFGAKGEKQKFGFPPNAVPAALRKEISGLETVAAFHNFETDVLIPDGTEKPKRFESRRHGVDNAELVIADPEFFSIFSYEWRAGNPKTALREPYQVVLSERKAHKYFGDLAPEQMLGKEVIYLDSVRVRVAGIVKDRDRPTDFTFTDFISSATLRASPHMKWINLDEWDDIWSSTQAFVKLPAGTDPAQLTKPFQDFSRRHFRQEFKFVPALQPLSDLHFDADYMDNYSRKAHLPTLYAMMAVALFILLIAAVNFINLATAQSVYRAREIGVRKVFGSSRKGLVAQFMSETAMLTFGAMVVAMALVGPVLSAFRSLIPAGLTYDLFSLKTIGFLAVVLIATSLLAGLYPSWVVSSYRPALSLKGHSVVMGGQKGFLRKGLIVFQFTISLIFIIGTLLVGRQMSFMRNKDLGFSTDAVVSVDVGRAGKTELVAERFRKLAGVDRVTKEWFPPMGESFMMTKLKYRGKREIEMDVSAKVGDENYIPLYGLRLQAGRAIMKSDTFSEMVINRTYAGMLGFRKPADALGKLVEWQGKYYPIVGVVADFHEQSFHEKIGPAFIAHMPRNERNLGVRLATKGRPMSEVKATLAAMEEQWNQVHPDTKFNYRFLDDSIARLYEKETKTSRLVSTATGIAILISCMGLFGLATFTAEQRTKEIGVRKVLGASVASIVALLSKDFLKLVGLALLIASPVAWWAMDKWLQDFIYRIDIEWWVFVLAGVLACGIALLTVSFQSLRAALTNPVNSLRSE